MIVEHGLIHICTMALHHHSPCDLNKDKLYLSLSKFESTPNPDPFTRIKSPLVGYLAICGLLPSLHTDPKGVLVRENTNGENHIRILVVSQTFAIL